jgi:hypothetical protein
MATSGRNEGFHVLEDFTTEALPEAEADAVPTAPKGRGVNPGMHVVTELVSWASQPPVSAERIAELRQLSTPQLLALVRGSGPTLTGQELLLIHDVAAERLAEDGTTSSDGAGELSREVMLTAVNKSA